MSLNYAKIDHVYIFQRYLVVRAVIQNKVVWALHPDRGQC